MDKDRLEKIILFSIIVGLLILLMAVIGNAFRPEEVNNCKGVYTIVFTGNDYNCAGKCHRAHSNLCGFSTASGISTNICYCYIPSTRQDSPELDWILGYAT